MKARNAPTLIGIRHIIDRYSLFSPHRRVFLQSIHTWKHERIFKNVQEKIKQRIYKYQIDREKKCHQMQHIPPLPRHARIKEFSSGGGGSRSVWQKKFWRFFFFFFSPQLILQKSNGQFQRNLSFFKVPGGGGGVQHFPGGVQLFPGGGVQLLIPYRNPYNLWFSRGVRTPCPPSGSALARAFWNQSICSVCYLKYIFSNGCGGGHPYTEQYMKLTEMG